MRPTAWCGKMPMPEIVCIPVNCPDCDAGFSAAGSHSGAGAVTKKGL